MLYESRNYTYAIRSGEKEIARSDIEVAIIFNRKGKELFRQSSGEMNRVQFTEKQLTMMKDAILTHNHPSNSTFSVEDIELMIIHDLQSIRATGKMRTYQLSKGTWPQNGKALIGDYRMAMEQNKAITDKKNRRIVRLYMEGKIKRFEYVEQIGKLNQEMNELQSQWLQKNVKKYGYRYSIIRGR